MSDPVPEPIDIWAPEETYFIARPDVNVSGQDRFAEWLAAVITRVTPLPPLPLPLPLPGYTVSHEYGQDPVDMWPEEDQ